MKTPLDFSQQNETSGVRRILSRQGRIAIPVILLAAVCFLDQQLNATHSLRPSGVLVLGLSCPLGWIAYWSALSLSELVASANSLLAFLFVFVSGAAGTVLNIYLGAAFIAFCSSRLGGSAGRSTAKIEKAEFQSLLEEHRKV